MSEGTRRSAVAIGGGTGLPKILGCLLDLGFDTTAVVTVADDGGSSGKLRVELGVLPPGDVRNCLVALGDGEGTLGRLFQYRFQYGEGLAGHSLGNLIIAALCDMAGSFPAAIEEAACLLSAEGHVFPSTLGDVSLHATDVAGRPVSGQACIAASEGRIVRVWIEPDAPPPYEPAVEAIRLADVVVIGPGSLFTSVIPNILVPGIAQALRDSSAGRVYVCNVANQRGETRGMDAYEHVKALMEHGLEDALDTMIVQATDQGPEQTSQGIIDGEWPERIEPVDASSDVLARIEALGLSVDAADVVDPADRRRHSRHALCGVLGRVVA